MHQPTDLFWTRRHETFDVVIVGGGIQGACLYARLVQGGRRVLLIDRGDFGGGTSQASAMLIWGGLLYLKNWELGEVIRLSASRDRLVKEHRAQVEPHHLSYVFGTRPFRQPWYTQAGLWFYWLLGGGRRRFPRRARTFAEQAFLAPGAAAQRLRFEEGRLRISDAQFVASWADSAYDGEAMNYCKLEAAEFDKGEQQWRLALSDQLGCGGVSVMARCVVNASGVWTNRVNDCCGIESPWTQLFAKGVSFCIPRLRGHDDTLVFDNPSADEGLSLVPWGPVALWGSTESMVRSPDEGWCAERSEVDYLLMQLNAKLRAPIAPQKIVSLRCGVRSLVVPVGSAERDPLTLSKRWRVHRDEHRPWVSVFGGKITACVDIASAVEGMLSQMLRPPRHPPKPVSLAEPELVSFPGLDEPVPGARWCRNHRRCRTLDDYLRRRTDIAQWVPRGGLGEQNQNRSLLRDIATTLCDDDAIAGETMLGAYEQRIVNEHDRILGLGPQMSSTTGTQ